MLGLTRGHVAAAFALLALFAGGLFAAGAVGEHRAGSHLIVVNRSIGDVAIRMSQAAVRAKLGAPRSTLRVALPGGGAGTLSRFTAHGAAFFVTFDASGHVLAIQTYSPYYRTAGGVGPRSKLAAIAGRGGFHVDFCSYGYWNGRQSTPRTQIVTFFLPAGNLVDSVLITELALSTQCVAAAGEVTLPQAPPAPEQPPGGSFRLHVDVDAPGSGSVVSSPPGISCPVDCEAPFGAGATITLTARPTSGFAFDHWSGDCTGSGGCAVTMGGPRAVTAHFTGQYVPPAPPPSPPPPPTITTGTGES